MMTTRRMSMRAGLPLAVLLFFATACTHTLEVKNLDVYATPVRLVSFFPLHLARNERQFSTYWIDWRLEGPPPAPPASDSLTRRPERISIRMGSIA